MFFQLCGECYLVKGEREGVIYHLLKEEMVRLTEEETQALLQAEKGEECEREPFMEQLQQMEWGFFSDKRVFVDKLRPYNSLMLLRRDLMTFRLETAFLQLTSKCSCGEKHCKEMFCTPCRTVSTYGEEISFEEWKNILNVLAEIKAENVILTGGDLCQYERLGEIIRICRELGLSCSVVLSHYHKKTISQIPKDVPVLVYVCDFSTWEDCIKIAAERKDAVIILNEKMSGFQKKLLTDMQSRIVNVHAYHVLASENNVRPCNLEVFYGKRDGNYCLKGKMYILSGGDVVTCYQSADKVIGNLQRERFQDVYRRLVEECWCRPVQHKKCKKCSLFYGCNVCMCMDPAIHCSYDPLKDKEEL